MILQHTTPEETGRPHRAGMTLIELMVSVAVMVIMIVGFGMIMNNSQKVVRTTQANIRANAIAEAISRAIRYDLENIQKAGGYLCIRSSSNERSTPMLFYTPDGGMPVHSVTDRSGGTSYLLAYGLTNNASDNTTGINTAANILLRQRWVRDTTGPIMPGSESDLWQYATISSRWEFYTRIEVGLKPEIPSKWPAFPDWALGVPPRNASDLLSSWQVLSTEVNGLSIMWYDGNNWYGTDCSDPPNGGLISGSSHSAVRSSSSVTIDIDPPDDTDPDTIGDALADNTLFEFEIDSGDFPDDPTYLAMWGPSQGAALWPRAIRVSFRLIDPTLKEGEGGVRTRYYTYTSGGEKKKVYYTRYEVVVGY